MATRTTALADLVLAACEERGIPLLEVAHQTEIHVRDFLYLLFVTPDRFTLGQILRIAKAIDHDPGVVYVKAVA